jgi:hypothetical protein
MGERVAEGWRGGAEPYPELGEGECLSLNAIGVIRLVFVSASADRQNAARLGWLAIKL